MSVPKPHVRGRLGARRAGIKRRRPKQNLTYTVADAAQVCRVTENTIRRWLAQGLPTLDDLRPTLIHGAALIAFQAMKRAKAKKPCPPGTMFCLPCRLPRPPAFDEVEFVAGIGTIGNLRALCPACSGVMNRRCRADRVSEAMPNLTVTITRPSPRLEGCRDASQNDDFSEGQSDDEN